jgi:hypothetical protein
MCSVYKHRKCQKQKGGIGKLVFTEPCTEISYVTARIFGHVRGSVLSSNIREASSERPFQGCRVKAGFMLERAVFETAIVRDTPMFRVTVF